MKITESTINNYIRQQVQTKTHSHPVHMCGVSDDQRGVPPQTEETKLQRPQGDGNMTYSDYWKMAPGAGAGGEERGA